MECINHKGTDATSMCTQCGAPICDYCTCTLDNYKVCPSCFETACRNNILLLKRNLHISFVYFLAAFACYIVGIILLFNFNDSIGLFFLGLLLMGLPNVITFFNRRAFGIIGTLKFWGIIAVLEIIFGIIATPIIFIKSAIRCAGIKANCKIWETHLKNCLAAHRKQSQI